MTLKSDANGNTKNASAGQTNITFKATLRHTREQQEFFKARIL